MKTPCRCLCNGSGTIDLLVINLHLQRIRVKGPVRQVTKPFIAPFGRLYGTLDAFRAANLEALLGRLEYMSIRAEQMLEKSDQIPAHVVDLRRV